MNRKDELIKIICENGNGNENVLLPLIEKAIFLENKLNDLENLPFYKVNPSNSMQQKTLPAFKIYKELLQQYTNVIKTLANAAGQDEKQEESPLRKWVKGRMDASEQEKNLDTR